MRKLENFAVDKSIRVEVETSRYLAVTTYFEVECQQHGPCCSFKVDGERLRKAAGRYPVTVQVRLVFAEAHRMVWRESRQQAAKVGQDRIGSTKQDGVTAQPGASAPLLSLAHVPPISPIFLPQIFRDSGSAVGALRGELDIRLLRNAVQREVVGKGAPAVPLAQFSVHVYSHVPGLDLGDGATFSAVCSFCILSAVGPPGTR